MTVDMGEPVLVPEMIPVISKSSEAMISEEVKVGGKTYLVTAVSMGNPHAVIFTDSLSDELVLGEGAALEVPISFRRSPI